jgi:hypothetical protein
MMMMMKTIQWNKTLNIVLGGVAVTALLSGCDLTSLRSSLSGNSSHPAGSTSSVYGNDPGYGTGQIDPDFGGHSSKKESQQKSSGSYSSKPSYPTYPSYPSYPSGPSSGPISGNDGSPSQGPHSPGNSYPGNSTGSGYTGGGMGPNPYARAHGGTSQAAVARRPIGESCAGSHESSRNAGQICLGVKYVSYVDGQGDDVESELDAIRDIEVSNRIWRDCGIQFQLEDYQSVQPQSFELRYQTRNYEELNEIRGTFNEPGMLLVVATGRWDRSGTLGNSWANAWTNLPGERYYGVVLERAVTSYPQILAHELGHYLSLDHKNDARSLMNPVVGRDSIDLSRQECKEARWAARSYWREMMR